MTTLEDQLVTWIPHLRRYARILTGNPTMADDLVQDCLERAIERLEQFQPGTNLRAWLFAIMYSIYVNQWRKRKRRGIDVELSSWVEGNQCRPLQEDGFAVADVWRALENLQQPHRSILLLIGIEGFSYKEAAVILNEPMGTIRSRLSRAREALRRSLVQSEETDNKPADNAYQFYPTSVPRTGNANSEHTSLSMRAAVGGKQGRKIPTVLSSRAENYGNDFATTPLFPNKPNK